jgi:DNA repair protein RecO (recombination protein O)
VKLSFSGESALPQGEHAARGVVLRRKVAGKSQELLLFLSSHGATWASAPGAGVRNRFGAGTEPMMWGEFHLYQSPRRLYLKEVDVREDFWSVRQSPRALRTAVKWCGELASRLMPGVMSDNLLSLFWGCMKNLSGGLDPVLLDVRFAWRWGNLWGVAPSLDSCASCGRRIGADALFARRSPEGFLCDGCFVSDAPERAIYKPLPVSAVSAMKSAATLSREKFPAWAAKLTAEDAASLSDCPSWLYSFL